MRVTKSMIIVAGSESAETRLGDGKTNITHMSNGYGFQNNSEPEENAVCVTNIGASPAYVCLGNGVNWGQVTVTKKDALVNPGESKYFKIYARMIPIFAAMSASSTPAVLAVGVGSGIVSDDAASRARALETALAQAGIRQV